MGESEFVPPSANATPRRNLKDVVGLPDYDTAWALSADLRVSSSANLGRPRGTRHAGVRLGVRVRAIPRAGRQRERVSLESPLVRELEADLKGYLGHPTKSLDLPHFQDFARSAIGL